ncbi:MULTISPECIES: hypothetical protein [Streptosporangium]|uniref:Uncharacterized protein n=1 Tax=Streptosporangium brasiliense TaxID=47480 RepID=A0ABT9R0V9_9ACTN|nr:hypothetical protein [Streptosporangium brasiliense]MDP9862444.1 hypothetical protein [Streptosporangium brasiliense]
MSSTTSGQGLQRATADLMIVANHRPALTDEEPAAIERAVPASAVAEDHGVRSAQDGER